MKDSCILHIGATVDGYGVKKYRGKCVRAHRLAFCEHNKIDIESIKNSVIMHSCDNPMCVNPLHLSEGSHADNCADKVAKERQARGEKCGRSKLKDAEVLEIIDLLKFGISGKSLAQAFNVTPMCISKIKTKRTWGHLWEE